MTSGKSAFLARVRVQDGVRSSETAQTHVGNSNGWVKAMVFKNGNTIIDFGFHVNHRLFSAVQGELNCDTREPSSMCRYFQPARRAP
jgi:hypothetical protein